MTRPARVALSLLTLLLAAVFASAAAAAPSVTAAIDVGDMPSGIAVGEGFVWVANSDSDTVSQIDPADNTVLGEFFATEAPGDIAVGAGHLWVIGNTLDVLVRLEIAHLDHEHAGEGEHEHEGLPVGRDPAGVVFDGKTVWVTSYFTGTVWRVDGKKFAVRREPVPVGAGPLGLALGEGRLWVANSLSDTVTVLNPHSGKVVGRPIMVADEPWDVAASRSRARSRVVYRGVGVVSVIDPRSFVVAAG